MRQHLVDMNNVMLAAEVKDAPIDGGLRFDVTGEGAVRDSIRRMVEAHAVAMNGVDGLGLRGCRQSMAAPRSPSVRRPRTR